MLVVVVVVRSSRGGLACAVQRPSMRATTSPRVAVIVSHDA